MISSLEQRQYAGVEAGAHYEDESTIETVDLGDYEHIKLQPEHIICLSQVRGKPNKEQGRLTESIRKHGMLTPINVIRMDDEAFTQYVEFINEIWKTTASADKYECQRHPAGYFYVVFGGHSRVAAVRKIQEETPNKKYRVPANVHRAATFDEVMELQIEDNIHSGLSKEEEAVLVVEMYEYGKRRGLWKNKIAFRRKMEKDHDTKISDGLLTQALYFAELPAGAREMVFLKQIPYAAGVQLGRDSEVIRQYEHMRVTETFKDLSPQLVAEEVENNYHSRIARLTNSIYNKRLNGPAAVRCIEGEVAELKVLLMPSEQREAVLQVQAEMFMVSPEDKYRQDQRNFKSKVREQEANMMHFSIDAVTNALRISRTMTGDIDPDLQAERQRRIQLFGAGAISATHLSEVAD